MFKKSLIILCFSLWVAQAQSPFDPDDLNAFYDEFVCEEKNITAEIDLTSSCDGVPPPQPPRPPFPPFPPFPPTPPPIPPPAPPPSPPPPLVGYVPIVLINRTGLQDSEVFFVAFGTQVSKDCPAGSLCPCPVGNQSFVSFGAQPGPFNPIGVVGILPPQPSATYSYAFSDIPLTNGQRVIYIPAAMQGGEIIFSVFNTLNLFTSVNNIAVPNPSLLTDPNYSRIYQQFEFTFLPPNCQDPSNTKAPLNQLSIDLTAVDYFSLPIQFTLYFPNPTTGVLQNLTAGILQTRRNTIQSLLNAFNAAIGSTSQANWNKLVIPHPNASPIIRILSPGESMFGPGAGVPHPHMFDVNYFDDATAYGYSWAENVWYGSNAYYQQLQNRLTIVTGADTFTGKVLPSTNTFVFTSTITGKTYTIPWQVAPVPANTPEKVAMSTSAALFNVSNSLPGMTFTAKGGLPQPVSALTGVDLTNAIEITKMLSSAIIAGIIPGKTNKLTNSGPANALTNMYYTPNTFLPQNGYTSGPWFDLYSLGLIGTGNMATGNIVYAYPYDDYLYSQSTTLADVAPTVLNITPQTYIVIQLNEYSDR